MTFMNSARKNIANFAPEYSVAKPATSSPSASGRSKGGRCVSATEVTKKITNAGSIGMMCQAGMKPSSVPDWFAMMSLARREFA